MFGFSIQNGHEIGSPLTSICKLERFQASNISTHDKLKEDGTLEFTAISPVFIYSFSLSIF